MRCRESKKYIICCFLLFYTINASAQLTFPNGFKRIKGERGSGVDDVYSNGRYSFRFHRESFFYDDYTTNDEKLKNYVSKDFGFPFYLTKDSLLWGTGKSGDVYSYVIVDRGGEAIELISYYNDSGFSYYSRWLLSILRSYQKNGRAIMFPMH